MHGSHLQFIEMAGRTRAGVIIAGIALMICGLVPWLARLSGFSKLIWLMIPATVIVFVDGFARWVGREYESAMAIEIVLQAGLPILFLMALRKAEASRSWVRLATILAAMTFLGHALYAVGFHTVPLEFKLMTRGLLGVSENGAIIFMAVVGWLDIVAAVEGFFKVARIPSLLYMVAWGGLTALARVASHFDTTSDSLGRDPWLVETLVRTPHWLIPLLLLALIQRWGLPRGGAISES